MVRNRRVALQIRGLPADNLTVARTEQHDARALVSLNRSHRICTARVVADTTIPSPRGPGLTLRSSPSSPSPRSARSSPSSPLPARAAAAARGHAALRRRRGRPLRRRRTYGTLDHHAVLGRSPAWRPHPTARATGSWARTAGSSPSATPPSTGHWVRSSSTGPSWPSPRPPTARATGSRPSTAGSSPSATPPSTGRWGPPPRPTHRGHGDHPRRQGVLARGRRRRGVLLRRRHLLRVDGGDPPRRRASPAWPPPATARATGWSPATAGSSPSATPPSTGRWAASRRPTRSPAWPPPPTGDGYWMVGNDGSVYPFGDAQSFGSTRDDQAHRARRRHHPDPRRPGVLAVGARRLVLFVLGPVARTR